jgi:hypothetical protein
MNETLKKTITGLNEYKNIREPEVKIKPCPDCQKDVSIHAAACPHCGSPLKQAVTIEKTGKKWKLLQLCGAAACIFGVIGFSENPTLGAYLLLGGIMLFISARIFAWWYHG